jgi:hypothetical protein
LLINDGNRGLEEDDVIGTFIIGAIVGGAAVWYYGPQMRAHLEESTREVRSRAADTLQSAAEGLQSVRQSVAPGTEDVPGAGAAKGKDRRSA